MLTEGLMETSKKVRKRVRAAINKLGRDLAKQMQGQAAKAAKETLFIVFTG